MVGHAIDMLRRQGFCGDLSEIMIVGDRFDTDIRAGVSAGIRTCLVESGCHSHQLQAFYPTDRADFVAESVAELLPPASLPRRVSAGLDVATPARTRKPSSEEPRRPSAAPGSSPRASLDSLRSWMLSRGNLVYASSKAPSLVPLVQRLRRYFDDQDPDATGYISATDTYLALKQLGIAPQQRTLPRAATVNGLLAAHDQPPPAVAAARHAHAGTSGMGSLAGVGEGGGSRFATVQVGALSRVTFRQFFREVQRGFELASVAPAAHGSAPPAAPAPSSPAARRSAAAALICCKDAGASALRRLPSLPRAPLVAHALRRAPSASGWAEAPPVAGRGENEPLSPVQALPVEAEEEASLFGNRSCQSSPGGRNGASVSGSRRSVDDSAACGLEPTGESTPRRVRSGHCSSPLAAADAGSLASRLSGGTGAILSSLDLFDVADQQSSVMRRNAASLPRDMHLYGGAIAEERCGAACPPPPEQLHATLLAPPAVLAPPHAKKPDLHEVGLRRAHTEG
jgi:hypothetical protein